MYWYAETPRRRTRQVLGDLAVVAWVVGWVMVGRWVHDLISALAAPAGSLRSAGTGLSERMTDIAGRIIDIPLVGDDLDAPFTGAAGVGTDLVAAGDSLETSVDRLAWVVSLLAAGTPIVLVVGAYLLLRGLGMRRAAALGRDRDRPGAQELLALRALVHQSPRRLQTVTADPLGAWRSGDPGPVAELADLELRRVGLRVQH